MRGRQEAMSSGRGLNSYSRFQTAAIMSITTKDVAIITAVAGTVVLNVRSVQLIL